MRIEGEKIKLLRQAMRWPQLKMANVLGLPQSHLSAMESGVRPVPDHLALKIGFLTGFSTAYLSRPITADVPIGSDLWYRKPRDKYRKSDQSQAYCQLVFDTFEPLSSGLKTRPCRLSSIIGCTPAEAADHVRNALSIRPGVPMESITLLAEKAGVRLVGVGEMRLASPEIPGEFGPEETLEEFEAFSFWTRDRLPVIFVRSDLSADRLNWCVGHEIIHLVQHSGQNVDVRKAESEAQAGAKELFLPADAIVESVVPGMLSVRTLESLALRWNVSLKSLVLRLGEVGVLTEPTKRYYLGAVNKGAGRDSMLQKRLPGYYRQMCEVIFGKPIPSGEIARRTGASRQFIEDVLVANGARADLLG